MEITKEKIPFDTTIFVYKKASLVIFSDALSRA